ATANLRAGRRRAGLVIDNHILTVLPPLDAVGTRSEREFGFTTERNLQPAIDLTIDCGEGWPPLFLPGYEPTRDALEARPPERLRLRIIGKRSKAYPASCQQFIFR